MTRKHDESTHGHLYNKVAYGMYMGCFYCGERADTLDHCPPISRADDYLVFNLEEERWVLVDCCRECNGLLSDSLQETIVERAELLKLKLTRRYRSLLRTPKWTAKELRELGRMLRSSIDGQATERARIQERLEYNGGISAYLGVSYDVVVTRQAEPEAPTEKKGKKRRKTKKRTVVTLTKTPTTDKEKARAKRERARERQWRLPSQSAARNQRSIIAKANYFDAQLKAKRKQGVVVVRIDSEGNPQRKAKSK